LANPLRETLEAIDGRTGGHGSGRKSEVRSPKSEGPCSHP
jgi:hypothetical protein